MKVDAAHRPVVLVKLVDQRADAVVPQLNDARMQRGENPRALRVEGEALHAARLAPELGQHRVRGALRGRILALVKMVKT